MTNNLLQQHTNKGAALLIFLIFFLFASTALTYLISKSIYTDFVSLRLLTASKTSYLTAESSVEDVAYRYISGGFSVDATEVLVFGGSYATTTSTVNAGLGQLFIDTESDDSDAIRKLSVVLEIASGASFNFGVQSGNGGFQMNNTAAVHGNVFSNGTIVGGSGASKAAVYGDVISAGSSGLVDNIHATGSVRSHEIDDSEIDGDAYYQVINLGNTTVLGTLYPGSADEATTSLPFPDSEVDKHKATVTSEILAGNGTHYTSTSTECSGGTWTIDTDTTFTGPTKIDCNLVIKKQGAGTKLTVDDTVWISGNLDFQSGPEIESNPTQATRTVLFIVDNESDRINSSQITVGQGTLFSAPSSPKAYIMLLSMNEDAENGGSNTAISMGQSSNGDVIVYAGSGKVTLANSIILKEVTGYLIDMGQSSEIYYESGLINLNFTSGPGGGFELGTWNEVE